MAFLKSAGTTIRIATELLASLALLGCAGAQEIEEYQLKAAYLYNFAKFVDWPAHAFAGASSPIAICILREDPFGGALEEVIRDKTAAGRPLVARTIDDLPARGCHILFIASREWKRSRPGLRPMPGIAILTVGETAGFTAAGGMVSFKLDGGRVRFEINLEAARQASLQISSKLLSLAEIVRTRE